MDEDLNVVEMPNGIDDPQIVMLWSIDEFGPIAICFIVGFLFEKVLLMLVVGLIMVKFYRRFRDGKQDGVITHATYWFGLLNNKGYSFINPYIRRWFP